MRIGDAKFPNLETRRLAGGRIGYYWNPPPAARGVFHAEALGDDDDMTKVMERWSAAQKRLADWRLEEKAVPADGAQREPPRGTVDWLVWDYKGSQKFRKNEEITRNDYTNKLAFVCNWRLENGLRLGSLPWAELRARHTDKLYQRWCYDESGEQRLSYARAVCVNAKIVWNYAKRYWPEHFRENPWQGMGLKTPKPRRVKWLPSQVRTLVETAENNGRMSIALAALFCYELGQRPSDARAFERSALEGNSRVRVIQQKTEKELQLPLSEQLCAAISKIPAEQQRLCLDEATGKPYELTRLSHVFADIRELAGLPSHLQLRDLRRTCISELGDLGASDDELVSVSGHADRQMLHVYSVADYERALKAMQRRWKWRGDEEKADMEREQEEAA
jgi:integrase